MTTFEGFGDEATRHAVVVADDGAAADAAQDAARAAGVGVRAMIGFSGIAAALDEIAHADVLLVEAVGVAPALLDTALPLLQARMTRDRAQMIVAFTPDQIDIVTLYLLGGPAVLLCDAQPGERAAAIALGGAAGTRFNAPERDAERLRRLNAEVARIAEMLAKLARDEVSPGGVQDRKSGFVAPAPAADDRTIVAATTVRSAIRARRLRDGFFPDGLFADPAWDMLLDLFAARLEGNNVSVSSLCIAAAVPPTTALRWITTLTDAGLLARTEDPSDRRRAFITLSAHGVAGMQGYGQAVAKAGLGWG